jgi:hypothetical protein
MNLEEYLTLVEQDPEHAYEYLDGRAKFSLIEYDVSFS